MTCVGSVIWNPEKFQTIYLFLLIHNCLPFKLYAQLVIVSLLGFIYTHSVLTHPLKINPLQERIFSFLFFFLSARSRCCWNDSTIFLTRNKAMIKWVCFQWNVSCSHSTGGSRKTQPELSCLCSWILTLFRKNFTPPVTWHLALFLLPRDKLSVMHIFPASWWGKITSLLLGVTWPCLLLEIKHYLNSVKSHLI